MTIHPGITPDVRATSCLRAQLEHLAAGGRVHTYWVMDEDGGPFPETALLPAGAPDAAVDAARDAYWHGLHAVVDDHAVRAGDVAERWIQGEREYRPTARVTPDLTLQVMRRTALRATLTGALGGAALATAQQTLSRVSNACEIPTLAGDVIVLDRSARAQTVVLAPDLAALRAFLALVPGAPDPDADHAELTLSWRWTPSDAAGEGTL